MCSFTTDYEMMLAVLINQNEGYYKDSNWDEVKIKKELLSEDGYRYIKVPSHDLAFVFDIEERFVGIVNYKE